MPVMKDRHRGNALERWERLPVGVRLTTDEAAALIGISLASLRANYINGRCKPPVPILTLRRPINNYVWGIVRVE